MRSNTGVSRKWMTLILVFLKQLAHKVRSVDMPVLLQEMRIRQRGIRPFVIMFIYIAVLSCIALFMLVKFSYDPTNSLTGVPQTRIADLGRNMFLALSVVQMLMISFIVPAYSAGAVAGERDKGTFILLALTLLESSSIVGQKLLAAAFDSLMLVIASIPVVAVVFLLGGISPVEFLCVYTLIVLSILVLSAVGILCSCICKNLRASVFVAYLVTLISLVGIPIACAWLVNVASMGIYQAASEFPVAFILMFAFVGAIFAFIAYGILAMILSRRTTLWHTRAFRMGVFGGSYAMLLLLLSMPGIINPVLMIGGFSGGVIFPPKCGHRV